MKGRTALVVGATSSIARAVASDLARAGARVHVAARDAFEVERIASDLSIRHQSQVSWSVFEATEHSTHRNFVEDAVERLGSLDIVVTALGELGDQTEAQQDFEKAERVIDSNYTGVASLLTHVANVMENQGRGTIVGISSVAGDRGRMSNYVYGSAKGAFSLFLQGLRSRLFKCGVHVATVKPGFVDTKMTFGRPGMFLVAQPEDIAAYVMKAIEKRRDVVYAPWFWLWIMLIIRSIPEPVFKRLKL